MSSKRRLRRKACTGKKRHESQTEAVKHLIEISNKGKGEDMHTYKCKLCNGWHVGHIPIKIRKAREC